MKVSCLTQYLKEAVNVAERNTSKNQTLQILSSLFLEAEGNKIKLRATNLENAIEFFIPAKVEETGVVVIPAKTVNSFLSNVADDKITIQSQKNNLFIKTARTETLIRGYNHEDFPIFPKVEVLSSFNLPAPELKDALSSVVISASLSDFKPELASILFKIFKNTFKVAATDSFRLAEKIILFKDIRSEKLISFLIPQKSIQEVLRLLDNDEFIEMGVGKSQVVFKGEKFKFISRLTEGTFPDYDQIIPKGFKFNALAKRAETLSALRLAGVFVGKLNDVNLTFNPAQKTVSFASSSSDVGENISQADASIQGGELGAKFNWRYLLDGVSQIKSDYISFEINSPQTPLLIKGKGDNSYLYLVMPMRDV